VPDDDAPEGPSEDAPANAVSAHIVLFVLRCSQLGGLVRTCAHRRYVRFDTLLAFFLMLPSILLIPRPFMDFMTALEPRATAGDLLVEIVEEGGRLDRRRQECCLESGFFGGKKATSTFSK
jgi:hypothetical protein